MHAFNLQFVEYLLLQQLCTRAWPVLGMEIFGGCFVQAAKLCRLLFHMRPVWLAMLLFLQGTTSDVSEKWLVNTR